MITQTRASVVVRLLVVVMVALAAVASLFSIVPSSVDAQSGCVTYHTVQYGENLYRIGLRYGVHYTTIAAANGINPNHIYAGQRLCIPGSGSTTTYPPTTNNNAYNPYNPYAYNQGTYPLYGGYYQQPSQPFVYVFPPFSNLDTYPPLANSPTVHQVNYWPQYGGAYARDSVAREPMITLWIRCAPESVNREFSLSCSKTGLGYFPIDLTTIPDPLLALTPTPAP